MDSGDVIGETIQDGSAALESCRSHFAADPIGTNMVAASLREGQRTELIRVADATGTLGAAVRWANGFTCTRLDERGLATLADALPVDETFELRAEAGQAATIARRWSERCGGSTVLDDLMRMHRLGTLRPPEVAGALAIATLDDLDRSAEWALGFGNDIGRPDDTAGATAQMQRAIPEQRLWLWQADGAVVAQLLTSTPRFGVVRIGGVYTPDVHRRHGFAAALTAAVSATLQTRPDVDEVVLNTQASNALTNRLYRRLGFESVFDMLVVTLAPG